MFGSLSFPPIFFFFPRRSFAWSDNCSTEAWTYDLDWIGKAAFQAAPFHEYKSTGKARTAKGLTYLQVYDAGHMVPTDQPENALEMMQNFIHGGKF